MAQHDHNLVDDDNRFIIDGGTRQLNNVSGVKPSLMQYDHNSEKFVFEMPRYIDGHDMLNCDRLEVHYTNSTSGTSKSSRVATAGVDNLTSSLQEDPEDSNKLTFEWTITQNATQLAGTLIFQFKFWCKGTASENEAEYIWHSGKYSFVEIQPSLNITDDLINKYPNAIEELDMRVDELEEYVEIIEDVDYQVYALKAKVDSAAGVVTQHGEDIEALQSDVVAMDNRVDALSEEAVSIDLSAFDTEGTITETFQNGGTKTTTLEFDENGNPVKITDADGNVTTLTW